MGWNPFHHTAEMAIEYPSDLEPLALNDIILRPTQLSSLDLELGLDDRYLIRFETDDPDFTIAANARDLAQKLVEGGVTNPAEVYDKVKKFTDEERARYQD